MTPIFRSFHRTASSTTCDWSPWYILIISFFRGYHIIFTGLLFFILCTFPFNGIGNKLIKLGVVFERNKVKVAVIQESKLSSKSKNPCIRNFTTWPHGHGGGLLVFIHESITFSKQPSSPDAQSDPHLEKTYHKGGYMENEADHFQHLHPSSQLLQ